MQHAEALMSFDLEPTTSETDDAARDLSEASDGGSREEAPASSKLGEERDILQLDASLKKLSWTLHYIESNKPVFPVGKQQHNVAIIAELVVHELFSLLDVAHDTSFKGEAWIKDITLKELPTSHHHYSEDKGEASILDQELYYRKTKPRKLDGGTMDTRRSSSKDTIVRTTFSYSKEDIEGRVCLIIIWWTFQRFMTTI